MSSPPPGARLSGPASTERFATLALLAVAGPLACWIVAAWIGHPYLYNDFHIYWYAGRLLATGTSPYDLAAMSQLAAHEKDVFALGTGFSYPIPFAFAMIPLGALPFDVAVVTFNLLSLVVFGTAVAAWLRAMHPGAERRRLRLAAFFAGAFPPVAGSLLDGQANLLVAGVLGIGLLTIFRPVGRAAAGGIAIGLAAIVKLVPGVVFVPLWLAGRRSAAAGIIAGAGLPLVLAAIVQPDTVGGGAELRALFSPDPYFTNQSINAFVSRVVQSSDRLGALAPGAFDPLPVAIALTAVLALVTLLVLWRCRARLATPHGAAIAVAFILVGATAGAPKTSFWNESLVLPAAGLLIAVTAPRLTLGELTPTDRRLLLAWAACILVQPLPWLVAPAPGGPAGTALLLLASLGLYGSLLLWWLLGRHLSGQTLPPHAEPLTA